MVNGADDWHREIPDGSGRPRGHREPAVNRPDVGELRAVLLRIGVDIWSQESVDDFARAYSWAREQAREAEEREDNRRKTIRGIIIAAVSGFATALATWLVSKLSGSH